MKELEFIPCGLDCWWIRLVAYHG